MSEVVLFTDGASRGNPGLAGAGVYITDTGGKKLVEKSLFLGKTTNNVAEYRALIIGLEEVIKINPSHVTVKMDSELIVKQLNGEYRVRNPGLLPLYRDAVERIEQINGIRVQHIPRNENREADRLANKAIDERE
ncbi:MAG: ribonuclease HI family protein, partial [Deltaproteobacteria bacterium]|nr:ribonuclease HI family protein [Deltaproteobacteria bacterium]MBW1870963.1 ribonuclease HI family protein [Deltaproteobacteria bacterium]